MTDEKAELAVQSESSDQLHGSEIVAQISGSAVGALVGLAVGGPPGAIIGASLGPGATAALQLAQHAIVKRFHRASSAIEVASQIAEMTPDDLASSILRDDRRLEAAMAALAAAASTPLPEKIGAFAAALAATATADETELDNVTLVVRALSELDEVHLRTLQAVAMGSKGGVTPTMLGDQLSSRPEALRGVVRMLELHGLITDRGRLGSEEPVLWHVTELGTFCLNLLSSRLVRGSEV